MHVLRRAIPVAAKVSRGRRRLLLAAVGADLLLLAATAASAITGVGGPRAESAMRDAGSCAVYVLVTLIVLARVWWVRTARASWALFAVGVCLYGIGNVLWSTWVENLARPPIPSICDGFWLAFYPLSYAGIVGLASGHGERRGSARAWLDGIVTGAGLAAVGAAILLPSVRHAAGGGRALAVGTELAYPVGDLLLAALVVGILAARGWRLERLWRTLGAGFLGLAAADCLYAVRVANGASTPSPAVNLLYVLGSSALAFAAWQPAPGPAPAAARGRWGLALPAGFVLAALLLLQYDHVHRLDPIAFGLCDVTIVAALGRCALALRDTRGLTEARRLAATDELTGLPNRRALTEFAQDAIAGACSSGGGMTLMVVDLDNFKELNDTLGHGAGDELLRLVGPRLRALLRGGDVVARLGGDEFAVMLGGCGEVDAAGVVAEKVLACLRESFTIHNLSLRLTASVGLAVFPGDGGNEQELLSRAEIAMYQAKRARTGHAFYSRERDTHSPERLSLAADLAQAIDCDELEIHYQPKADARSRVIVGAEALVRWRRGDGRLVPPDEFIGAAEEAGLSRRLTRHVLAVALDQVSAWRARQLDIHVAVNTTVSDLLDLDFPAEVAIALAERGLPAHALVLEVTESSVLSDPERIGAVLDALGGLGVIVALDDFGTGYSSLSHLIRLPVHELKVDRSFVRALRERPADAAVVDAMIRLGQKLGLQVVAEGVEDDPTWGALAEMGCDLVQGYGLSRPLPAAELEPLLDAGLPAPAPLASA